ncbi:uncharacterized protein B0H64DRAFT_380322 [Chaetomium fimeti]|uniref:Uncharacterized protein n=1 Tax=Chaetomium fimeti TaxID=1854472 RepID=A0AAE0LWK1_9PEZI|nr:hypothetical protein B0H64DRAFT_380322 [Chaetomium fimeti]
MGWREFRGGGVGLEPRLTPASMPGSPLFLLDHWQAREAQRGTSEERGGFCVVLHVTGGNRLGGVSGESATDPRYAGTFGTITPRSATGEPPGRAVHPGQGTLPMGKGFTILHLGQVRVEWGEGAVSYGREGKAKKGVEKVPHPPFLFPPPLYVHLIFFALLSAAAEGEPCAFFICSSCTTKVYCIKPIKTKLPDPSHLPPSRLLPIMTAVTFPRLVALL